MQSIEDQRQMQSSKEQGALPGGKTNTAELYNILVGAQ